ncbi:MAG TPA: CAP domain-containing protein [Dehalococcoidia bacterium]|nr:CAP domain-containing protein [Dehalococcoidia bacterium]
MRRPNVFLTALLLVLATLTLGCNSDSPTTTAGAGEDASSANADRVIVVTKAPEPTRVAEGPTPTQPPAPTIAVPTATPMPPTTAPTGTPTPSPTPAPSPSPTSTPNAPSTPTSGGAITGSSTLSSREQALFDAHNAERASRNIAPLTTDSTLQTIARSRAQIMAANDLFSHYAPNGDNIYDLFADANYPWLDATENIHFNDYAPFQADSVAMSEYMASPAHRANILKPGFHRVGVGVATSAAGTHYYSIVLSD